MHVDRYPSLKFFEFPHTDFFTLVFTKCAENLENGRRLENFSWRLWYREAHFFDDPSTTVSQPIPFDPKSPSHPQTGSPAEVLSELSSSVGSASDLDDDRQHASDQPHDMAPANNESHAPPRPCLGRRESSSRRQNVKQLSPESFKNLIESLEPPTAAAEKWKALKKNELPIEEEHLPVNQEPAAQEDPVPSAAPPAPKPAVPTDIPVMRARTMSDAHGSPGNGSGRSLQRVSSSIVRGFTPENPSISRRLAPPNPPQQARDTTAETRKKPKFYIGSSVSDSDEEDAPLTLKSSIKPPNKSNISPPSMKRAPSNGSVKKTHFLEIVDTKILPPTSAEESEDEDDSAIVSDDEDEEWEDSQSDGGEVEEQDDHMFDKREGTQLRSRGSMLSTLFKSKSDYNLPSQALNSSNAFIRSRNSPAPTPRLQTQEPPQTVSKPAPVSGITAGIHIPQPTVAGMDPFVQPIPASPRTTRRKMLASELSESLRRNLLWERQHRTMTNNNNVAALKRRHTSNDLARLKEFPQGLSGHEAEQDDFGKYAFDSGDAVW